jgi:hypothetical protein
MQVQTVLVVSQHHGPRREIADVVLDAGFLVFCGLNADETLQFQRAGLTWDAIVFDVRESWHELARYLEGPASSSYSPCIVAVVSGDGTASGQSWVGREVRVQATLDRLGELLRGLL